jgi:uncharacterized OsmC-like protein
MEKHTIYQVEVKNKGGTEFYAKAKDGEFMVDTAGHAMAPLEVLLAALGSSTSYFIKKYAQSANIQLDMFIVNVEAEPAKEGGYYFKEIKVNIDLDGALIDDIKKDALLQFVKNCPVHMTLTSNPKIEHHLL